MEHLKQTDKVLRHLKDYGSLTSFEAMNEYGIMRLASRITDLKAKGYDIVSGRQTVKNRYGEPVTIAVYRLGSNAS